MCFHLLIGKGLINLMVQWYLKCVTKVKLGKGLDLTTTTLNIVISMRTDTFICSVVQCDITYRGFVSSEYTLRVRYVGCVILVTRWYSNIVTDNVCSYHTIS
jgi:hypothetical protein